MYLPSIYSDLNKKHKQKVLKMELNATLIVGIYFLFLIAIGWMFRTFTSTTSDYFRGGGNMLWWMVGATAFAEGSSVRGHLPARAQSFTDGLR